MLTDWFFTVFTGTWRLLYTTTSLSCQQNKGKRSAGIEPVGGVLTFQMNWILSVLSWITVDLFIDNVSAQYNGFILLYWTKKSLLHHIRLDAQIHYHKMFVPSRFIQRIYWQTSSAACFTLRFYYMVIYHCHLLCCWWPARGQVSADHTCLYKPIINRQHRLQILWDNMSNRNIKHYSAFKMFETLSKYWTACKTTPLGQRWIKYRSTVHVIIYCDINI